MAFVLLGFLCLLYLCWSIDQFMLTVVVFFIRMFSICFVWKYVVYTVCLTLAWNVCGVGPLVAIVRWLIFLTLCSWGHSRFVAVGVNSWVPLAISHSDWSSCVEGNSVAALRFYVVLGFGITTCTSFTWWAGFLCVSISFWSFSTSAVASDCGVPLFCFSANELLWYCWFWVYSWFCWWLYGTGWYVENGAPMLIVPGA